MDSQERWHYNHLQEIHKKKLELIHSHSGKRIDNSPPETLRVNRTKFSSFQVNKTREYQDIYRKNQVLLDALNEISKRKVNTTQKRSPSETVFTPASLNLYKRKRDIEKITSENELIHKKLMSKEATLSMKQLDRDYQISLKYKKNLSKNFLVDSPKKVHKKEKKDKKEKRDKKEKKEKKERKERNKSMKDKQKKKSKKIRAVDKMMAQTDNFREERESSSVMNRNEYAKSEENVEGNSGKQFCDEGQVDKDDKVRKSDEISGVIDQNVNIDMIKKFSLKDILNSPQMFLNEKKENDILKTQSVGNQNPGKVENNNAVGKELSIKSEMNNRNHKSSESSPSSSPNSSSSKSKN